MGEDQGAGCVGYSNTEGEALLVERFKGVWGRIGVLGKVGFTL